MWDLVSCKGCEITEVICLIYVLTHLLRPFSPSYFLLSACYSHYFLLFFCSFNRKPLLPQDYEFWQKLNRCGTIWTRIRFFRVFFFRRRGERGMDFGIHVTREWQKFASPRSPNPCVNARNPSTNSTRVKVGRDIILWTRRSDGSDKRNVGRMRSVARSLTIISPVTSWKNNSNHRDREAAI